MPLTARDIMTAHPVTITPETPVAVASKILLENRFNGLPVVDSEGNLQGILCQSDLVMQHKHLQIPSFFTLLDGFIPLQFPGKFEEQMKRMSAVVVKDAMTPNPETVHPDMPLEAIATLMVDEKYHTLPVVENGKVVGVIGKEDILRTMISH